MKKLKTKVKFGIECHCKKCNEDEQEIKNKD